MVKSMTPETRVRKNASVVVRELAEGEGAVLLHLETGAYHGMNPVALIIWEFMDGERTVADLIEGVRGRVLNAPPHVDRDVIAFLESAINRDLVHVLD